MQGRLIEALHPAVNAHLLASDEAQPVNDVRVEASEPLRPEVVRHTDLTKMRQHILCNRLPVVAWITHPHTEAIAAQMPQPQLVAVQRCLQDRQPSNIPHRLKRSCIFRGHTYPLPRHRVLVLLPCKSHRSARHARPRKCGHDIHRSKLAFLDERVSVPPRATRQVARYLLHHEVGNILAQIAAGPGHLRARGRQDVPRKAQTLIVEVHLLLRINRHVVCHHLTRYVQTWKYTSGSPFGSPRNLSVTSTSSHLPCDSSNSCLSRKPFCS